MSKRGTSPFSVIIVFVFFSIIGLSLFTNLSVSLLPSRSMPSLSISYFWPNASARVIENTVTSKIEAVIARIQGVSDISSQTNKESGSISVTFDRNTDMNMARFYVATSLRQVAAQLPKGVSYPQISVNKASNDKQFLLSYSLYGNLPANKLTTIIKQQFQPLLSKISGVNNINIFGETSSEIFIEYNTNTLKSLHLSANEIKLAIVTHLQSVNVGFGTLKDVNNNSKTISIRINKPNFNKINWEEIPVKYINNRLICLGAVATITLKKPVATNYYRINGLPTVGFSVFVDNGVNSLKVAKLIKQEISNIKSSLHSGVFIINTYDATIFINKELNKVLWRTVIAIFVLLLFVLLVSKSWRYLLIIIFTLIVNLSIAIILYYLLGIEIHIYSLAGLTISLGIVIDNCIIMVDHIRHCNNTRAFMPILAATLTTIGALSIVLFLDYRTQLNLIDFSLVVIINLAVSLIVALWFVPAIMSYWPLIPKQNSKQFRKKKRVVIFNKIYEKIIRFQLKRKWIFIVLLILIFGLPVNNLPEKLSTNNYISNLYNDIISSRIYQQDIKKPLNIILGGSYRLFSVYVYGNSLYSEPSQTILYVNGKMPDGATITQMNNSIQKVERFISKIKGIKMFVTKVVSSRDGTVSIYFDPKYEYGNLPFILKNKLVQYINNIGGVDWGVYGVGRGFDNSVSGGFNSSNIFLYGYNYNQLFTYAKQFVDKIKTNNRIKGLAIKGSAGFSEPSRRKLVVDFNQEYITEIGLRESDVFDALQSNTAKPNQIANVINNNQLIKVNFAPKPLHYDLWDLHYQPLSIGNRITRFHNIAKIEEQYVGHNIYKKNQEYQIVIGFNFAGTARMEREFDKKLIQQWNTKLPIGYRAENQRWRLTHSNTISKGFLILIVAFIIFIILTTLFESLKQPFVILSLLPFSFAGIFFTFYWFNIDFDQGGYASFILLAGISVNAALYIVNEYNNSRNNNGKLGIKQYIKAYSHKITPIMLTIFSTILGLMPFILTSHQEPFWYAFAAGSIGGLIFSIIGLFVFLPAFFLKSLLKSELINK